MDGRETLLDGGTDNGSSVEAPIATSRKQAQVATEEDEIRRMDPLMGQRLRAVGSDWRIWASGAGKKELKEQEREREAAAGGIGIGWDWPITTAFKCYERDALVIATRRAVMTKKKPDTLIRER
jgi:hypothetical protein